MKSDNSKDKDKDKDNIYQKIYKLLGENALCAYSRINIENDDLRPKYLKILRSMKSHTFGGNYDHGPWFSFFREINTFLGEQKIFRDKVNVNTKIFKTIIIVKFNDLIEEIIIHNNRPIRLCELLFNISKKLDIISIKVSKSDSLYNEFINQTIIRCINY